MNRKQLPSLEEMQMKHEDLAQLARLALVGRQQDIQAYVQRLARRYRDSIPDLAAQLNALLQESPTRQSPLRREAAAPMPVDLESRLQLLRIDQHPSLEVEPIWEQAVSTALRQVVSERQRVEELAKQGLLPTRSLIFTGPPGVGKSLAARWIARELGRPLLTLDLSAVMSSFLGRTGANVRHVLDYAKGVDCVLLLDELDSIAKRRDDASDVGELKRLVTVLLQEIDDWPSTGLLIAATNHSDLLDPAVWRRFDLRVAFPMPADAAVRKAIDIFLGPGDAPLQWRDALSVTLRGLSFSDIERELMLARRSAVVHREPLEDALGRVVKSRVDPLARRERGQIALWLTEAGISQRQVHEMTGVSRDTIRKNTKSGATATVNKE
ncbi:MAG: ATP-binding protein [Verrucomicrobiota bacterium]|jgi:SpoVK/Ycf46/Vps4 family AAA+-type ATPase